MILVSIGIIIIWTTVFPFTIILAISALPAYMINLCVKAQRPLATCPQKAEDNLLIMMFAPIYWMKKLGDMDLRPASGQSTFYQLQTSRKTSEEDVEIQKLNLEDERK